MCAEAAGGLHVCDTAEVLSSGVFKKIQNPQNGGCRRWFCLEVFLPISLSKFIRNPREKKNNSVIIYLYAI